MAGPWEKYSTSGPVYGAAPKVEPYAAEDQQFQREGANRAAAAEARAQEAARRAELEWNATHNPDGSPKAKPPAAGGAGDVKLQAKRASLESLVTQINRVDDLYQKGLKDEAYGALSSLGEFLPTETNRQFNAAAAGLAEQGLSAFRVPGVGAQSDTELRQFIAANKPEASNYDATIEEKLLQLRTRVDATRAEMGMPPAQWGKPQAPEAQDRPAGPQVLQDNGVTMEAATDYKRSDDPALTGLKGEYLNRLKAGQSASQLMAWMKKAGVNLTPVLMKSVAQQAKFRKANPDVPVQQYNIDALDDVFTPTTTYQRTMGAAANTPFGAAAMAAGNAVTGNNLDSIVGMTGGNAEQARIALNDASNQHPYASLGGGIAGGVTAALGAEAALGAGGMAPGFIRSLTADTGYGAVAGAGGDDENRLRGAANGALFGAGGSALGQGIARTGGAVLRGVTNPSVRAVADNGPVTLGQAVSQSGRAGAIVKGAEDRLSGFGGVGDMINARRLEGVQAFNSRAFDKALEPIGAKVGGAAGQDGVTIAHEKVREAFRTALAGKSAVPDEQFITAARGPITRLAGIKRDGLGEEIVDQIEESTKDLFDPTTGALSGENMQSFLDALRQIRQSYKNDPLYARTIKPGVQGIENAVEGMFARQAPEVMPQFNAAKAAYRRVSILSDAVNASDNTDNLFAPSQLRRADLANAKKYNGTIEAAKGNRQFDDISRPAQKVLPSKVPDSGTAGRLAMIGSAAALPTVGGGLGYAGGDTETGVKAGIGLTAVLAAAYTRTGQAALAKMLLKRGAKTRKAGEALSKRARIAGASGAALGTFDDQ